MLTTILTLIMISFVAALIGAVIPGPVFAVTLTESVRRGSLAGPLIAIGHFMVEAAIIFLAFFGLGNLLKLEFTRISLGYLGGLALILMGIYFLLSSRKIQYNERKKQNLGFLSHGPILAGFLASLSNPYFFLWWVSPGFPLMYKSIEIAGLIGFVCFYVGHCAADLGWFGFVSFSTSKSKKILNEKRVGWIVVGGAFFLIILGFYFIYSVVS